jgi:hypothetical protein
MIGVIVGLLLRGLVYRTVSCLESERKSVRKRVVDHTRKSVHVVCVCQEICSTVESIVNCQRQPFPKRRRRNRTTGETSTDHYQSISTIVF